MINEILPIRLKQLLKRKNMNQKEFATFMGIPTATLSSYILGRVTPPVDQLLLIANKCNVSLDWLCDNEREKLSTLSDLFSLFFELADLQNIRPEFNVNQIGGNDLYNPAVQKLKFEATISFPSTEKTINDAVAKFIDDWKERQAIEEGTFVAKPNKFVILGNTFDDWKKEILDIYSDIPLIPKKKFPSETVDKEKLKKDITMKYTKES